jgi:GNAT superfamily N-acetyltransferase
MTTSRPVEVRPSTRADRDRAATVLAAAFSDDPVFRYMLPEGMSHRADRIRRFFVLELARSESLGGAWTSADGAGVAVWYPPGEWKASRLQLLRQTLQAVRIFGRQLSLAGEAAAAMQEHHPQSPHWYLYFLAAEPGRQGGGLGTALMRPVLARCDDDRVPAYLEATGERNRALYRRHGFADLEPLVLPRGGPTVHPMWREPR